MFLFATWRHYKCITENFFSRNEFYKYKFSRQFLFANFSKFFIGKVFFCNLEQKPLKSFHFYDKA